MLAYKHQLMFNLHVLASLLFVACCLPFQPVNVDDIFPVQLAIPSYAANFVVENVVWLERSKE